MSDKIILTIMTEVYCNDEYADKPQVAVIYLTQKKLDRYKHLAEVVKKEEVRRIQEYDDCVWLDHMPLYYFSELDKNRVYLCETSYLEYYKEPGEDPVIADQTCERINCELVNVQAHNFYLTGFGKYSGTRFESEQISFDEIDKVLAEEPKPQSKYFFQNEGDDYPKSTKDAPKYINSDDHVVKHYARELLKNGETNDSTRDTK